ncbi:DUF2384 domain-containing protein [Sulfitobacter dubius]|uniref:DUF2384 domain-containing protein n=1 Tax=Sulfitobacter dubius TaxID=218673 RepID=UPI0008EE2F9A|nr:DUF2384 domain-containing protein [Sulfitobacter dubius]SFH11068.1 hypothetical protein SAMN04488039_103124 [Sulfitobacter dubius]
MEIISATRDPSQINAAALKAYTHIAGLWSLGVKDTAKLADISEVNWLHYIESGLAVELTEEQLLRISAIIGIHKALEIYFSKPIASAWFTYPNIGPLFLGRCPLDTAINGGLPQIIAIRKYLDALLEGV